MKKLLFLFLLIPFLSFSQNYDFKTVNSSGTNTYTATVSSNISSYSNNLGVSIRFGNASSGSSTLNVNSIGAKKLFKTPTTQVGSGDIVANQVYNFVYSSSLDTGTGGFLMVGSGSSGGGAVSDADYGDVTVSSSGTVWTVDNPSFVTDATTARTISNSDRYKFITFTNSGAITVTLNSTPSTGTTVSFIKASGSGTITLSASGTYEGIDNTMQTDKGACTCLHKGSGNWSCFGALGAAAGGNPFADNTDLFKNSSDATKLIRFSLSGITTGTTRTWTFPDTNGTFARSDAAQTFTGTQTFTTNIAGSITGNAATVTTIPTLSGDVTNSGNAITVTKINSTSLAGLATGILKNTTGTGVPSIAASGTDYAPATPGTSVLKGNGSGGFSAASAGDIGVVADGVTITGNGTSGSPLVSSGLQPSNNLSDVSSVATSRTNLRALADVATFNAQSASYSLTTADFPYNNSGRPVIITQSNASANNLTIDATALSAVPVGSIVYGRRQGAGTQTFVPANGASLTSTSGGLVDPGTEALWAITKTGSSTYEIDNGGLPLGTANQILGVSNAGTAQEYKTVSNGLTSASGTFKLGGALTADTQFSGAFSLGLGVSPTSKFHVQGLAAGTASMVKFQNSTPTTLFDFTEGGKATWTASVSGASALANQWNSTLTATANSQTLGGYEFNTTVTPGAFTPYTFVVFKIKDTSAANDYLQINNTNSGSTFVFNSAILYDFKNSSSTSIIRNSAAALSLRGGTTSTTRMLQFTTTQASSTNNNVAFNFTGNTHDYGSALTRTATQILNDVSVTSVNGGTLTHTIFDNSPSFAVGTSTMTLTGYNYNPTLTSGTFTHYAALFQSGKVGIGTATPVATLEVAGSVSHKYVAKTANYTLTNSDYTVDCTTGSFTITLPTAVGIQGLIYVVKNSGAGTITLATTSSQTIDGSAPGTLAAGAVAQLQSTNANWIKIN